MNNARAQTRSQRAGHAVQRATVGDAHTRVASSTVGTQGGPLYSTGPIMGLAGPLQTEVAIGQAGDAFEREADAVANRVTAGEMIQPSAISALTPGALPQTMPIQKAEEKKPEQKIEDKKPVQKAETKQPEQKIENRKPVQKAEVKKPEEKKPEPMSVQRAEAKPPQQRVEDNMPVQKVEAKKPEEKKPVPVQRQLESELESMPESEPELREEGEGKIVQTDSTLSDGGAAEPAAMASAAEHAIAHKGPGSSLTPGTQNALETRMGTDFSHVRVHEDSAAQEAAHALNARAFTHGSDIWLGQGASPNDLQLMAHEATHVVQQHGGVHRMVQRQGGGKKKSSGPSGGTKTTTPGASSTPPPVNFTVDENAKVIIFDQLELPPFRVSSYQGRTLRRPKAYKRKADESNEQQQQQWKTALGPKSATTAQSFVEKKIKDAFHLPTVDPSQTYILKTIGGFKQERYIIGNLQTLVAELTIPTWDSTGRGKRFQVDHLVELQLGGESNVSNLQLLEALANRNSGFFLQRQFVSKLTGVIQATGTRYGKNTTDLLENYTLEFTQAVPATNFTPSNVGPTDIWVQDQIAGGQHVQVPNVDTVVRVGDLSQLGGQDKVMIFPTNTGWIPKSFRNTSKVYSEERDWLKPFTITNKTFDTSENSEQADQFGNFEIELKGSRKYKPIPKTPEPIRRHRGARYAGYVERQSIRQKAERIQDPRLSPLQIEEFDLLPEEGIYMRGRVLPTIPLIRDVGLEFEMRNSDTTIYKEFSTGDFAVPPPLRVLDSSLRISAGTGRGLGIDGRVDFAIDRVGQGYLQGAVSTSEDFSLEGRFGFDSKLFDPAEVAMEYKNGAFGIQGRIGIKEGKVRGVKSAVFTVAYKEGHFKASGAAELGIPGVKQGSMSLSYSEAEGLAIGGSFELADNIPGVKGGSGQALIRKRPGAEEYEVSASGKAEPKIPGVNASLAVAYENGIITVEGAAAYEKGMLKGSILVGVTNRPVDESGRPGGEPTKELRAYGGGSVTIRIAPWLQGTIGVRLLPNGEIEVSGSVGLPSTLEIFPEKKLDKNIFTLPSIDIPIVGVSVLGKRVGIFASIGGGLDLRAGIGPGQLQELGLAVTYNPAHEEQTHVTGGAKLHVPAAAGLRLYISGSIGASLLIVTAEGGIEVGGTLGLAGALDAGVQVDWTPAKGLVLDAKGEVFVEPKLKFDITGFVKVEADLLLKTVNLYSRRWELFAFEYGSGLRFGVKFPIHYEEGKPFDISLSDMQFQVPDIKPRDLLSDLVKRIA